MYSTHCLVNLRATHSLVCVQNGLLAVMLTAAEQGEATESLQNEGNTHVLQSLVSGACAGVYISLDGNSTCRNGSAFCWRYAPADKPVRVESLSLVILFCAVYRLQAAS